MLCLGQLPQVARQLVWGLIVRGEHNLGNLQASHVDDQGDGPAFFHTIFPLCPCLVMVQHFNCVRVHKIIREPGDAQVR